MNDENHHLLDYKRKQNLINPSQQENKEQNQTCKMLLALRLSKKYKINVFGIMIKFGL